MKKLIVLALASCIAFSAMNVSAKEKPSPVTVKDAIHSHMIDNGFMIQAELDADKTIREETLSLIKDLKEVGDQEAIDELKAELEANPDLQATIKEIVAEFKLNKEQNRSDRKAKNTI